MITRLDSPKIARSQSQSVLQNSAYENSFRSKQKFTTTNTIHAMKKIIFLYFCITTVLAIVGCKQIAPITATKIPSSTQGQTYKIEEAKLNITLPAGYSLEKHKDEPNRRGSFVSYNFKSEEKQREDKPLLTEVLFSSKESIKNFIKKCKNEDFCFEGYYPTAESFDAEKKAILEKTDYKENKNISFKNNEYLVETFRCQGDFCSIRQYTTFFQDIRADFIITTYPNTESSKDDAKADELFSQITITPYSFP